MVILARKEMLRYMFNRKYFIVVLLLALTSCDLKSNGQATTVSEKVKISPQKKAENLKGKPSYIVHVNALTPYEIYVDDILVDFHYGGIISSTIQLNPYLLGNGKHKLKVIFLPNSNLSNHLLSPKDIIFSEDARWHIFFTKIARDKDAPLGYSSNIDYAKSELKIEVPKGNVSSWEQNWTIDVDDLPYNLKGWTESQDLSKMDTTILKKDILDYFTKINTMLNDGKIDEYLELCKKEDEERDVATYTSLADSKIDYQRNREKMIKLCTGNMQNLDSAKLVVYGDGKLVSLIIPSGKYKNWNVLISKTPKGRRTSWGMMLHKPKGSSNFEIIRK